MVKKSFTPEGANVIGPYSPAVEAGGYVYLSGQIPVLGGKIIDGDIIAQTKQCLKNMSVVLQAAGLEMDDVFKTTIYLTDMNDFIAVNEIYADFFNAPYPARTTVCASALPMGAKIEIDAIAKMRPPG
jgi:2-iminobutanoate/2-iminopropanoate deaminase